MIRVDRFIRLGMHFNTNKVILFQELLLLLLLRLFSRWLLLLLLSFLDDKLLLWWYWLLLLWLDACRLPQLVLLRLLLEWILLLLVFPEGLFRWARITLLSIFCWQHLRLLLRNELCIVIATAIHSILYVSFQWFSFELLSSLTLLFFTATTTTTNITI